MAQTVKLVVLQVVTLKKLCKLFTRRLHVHDHPVPSCEQPVTFMPLCTKFFCPLSLLLTQQLDQLTLHQYEVNGIDLIVFMEICRFSVYRAGIRRSKQPFLKKDGICNTECAVCVHIAFCSEVTHGRIINRGNQTSLLGICPKLQPF